MSSSDSDHRRFERAHEAVNEMKGSLGYSGKEIADKATRLRSSMFPRETFNRPISACTISRLNAQNKGKRDVSSILVEVLEQLAIELRAERACPHLERLGCSFELFSLCLQQGVETSDGLIACCKKTVIGALHDLDLVEKRPIASEFPIESPGFAGWLGGRQKLILIAGVDIDVLIHELEEVLRYLGARQKRKQGGPDAKKPAW